MPRWAKITLVILGVLLVIGFLVPYAVDVDRYRPQIVAEVQAKTGRKIEIGNIRARIIPSAGFSIENVTLGPPSGFANVNLLTAESIQGSVSLLSLLHGTMEVTSMEIVKPQVALATDEHGRTNYDFSPQEAGKHAPSAPSSGSLPVALDSVSLQDAELSVVEVRAGRAQPASLRVSGINADLTEIDLTSNGISRWKGQMPLTGVTVRVAGLPPLTFRSGEMKIDKGAASGNYEMEVGDAGLVKGEFSISDLQKALAAPPHPTPQSLATGAMTAGKLRFAPYEVTEFSADVKAFGDHWEMPIRMSVYGGSLTVTARIETGGAAKRFSANVQLSRIDLEKLAAADPGTRGKIAGHAEVRMQVAGALGGNLTNWITARGNYALRDGKLAGIEAAKSIHELANIEHFFVPSRSEGAGGSFEITFTLIEGDLNIHGGRIYTTKTHAETNDGTGDIHGSIGFDQSLDLAGTWKLARTGSQQGGSSGKNIFGKVFGKVAKHSVGELPFAFTVKGTVKKPMILPGEAPQ